MRKSFASFVALSILPISSVAVYKLYVNRIAQPFLAADQEALRDAVGEDFWEEKVDSWRKKYNIALEKQEVRCPNCIGFAVLSGGSRIGSVSMDSMNWDTGDIMKDEFVANAVEKKIRVLLVKKNLLDSSVELTLQDGVELIMEKYGTTWDRVQAVLSLRGKPWLTCDEKTMKVEISVLGGNGLHILATDYDGTESSADVIEGNAK